MIPPAVVLADDYLHPLLRGRPSCSAYIHLDHRDPDIRQFRERQSIRKWQRTFTSSLNAPMRNIHGLINPSGVVLLNLENGEQAFAGSWARKSAGGRATLDLGYFFNVDSSIDGDYVKPSQPSFCLEQK